MSDYEMKILKTTLAEGGSLDEVIDLGVPHAGGVASAADTMPEQHLFVASKMPSLDQVPQPRPGVFIIGQPLAKLVTRLKQMQPSPGMPVMTMVGTSDILYSRKAALFVTDYLLDEGYLATAQKSPFQTALHEALLNAIEHGNLGMSSEKPEHISTVDWFGTYRKKIHSLLGDAAYAERLVSISIGLDHGAIITRVEDEGEGFDISHFNPEEFAATTHDQPHGAGLHLIHAMADSLHFEKDGRCTVFGMSCRLSQNPHLAGIHEVRLANLREHARILIVDDQEANRQIARFYLQSAGYVLIEEAADGEQALHCATTFLPDIILLDIVMPGMNGFTVCRHLKQNEDTAAIPVLFLSGLADVANRVKGYRIGAVDYVTKPIDRNELVARVDTQVQNSMMLRALHSYSNRVRDDLSKARRLQENLLPTQANLDALGQLYGVSLRHRFTPCNELAGDYWSAFPIDDQRLGMVLGDFTGHGVVAALNTVRMHAMMLELQQFHGDPVTLATTLNDHLFQQLSIDSFATFLYGIVDIQDHTFTYISCGSPPPLVYSGKNHPPCVLAGGGLPLGLLPSDQLTVDLHTTTLNDGDALLLYSDALLENRHENGKMWEMSGLLDTLKDLSTAVPCPTDNCLFDHLLKTFDTTAKTPLADDLTVLSLTLGHNLPSTHETNAAVPVEAA